MRKYLGKIVTSIFILAALLPSRAWAAEEDQLLLDKDGRVTIVSEHAAGEGISTLSFSLAVEASNAASVEFQFEAGNVKILESRYDEADGKLNVYMAGKEALFADGTNALNVGRIRVLDAGGNEVSANVSVVEDSLQYVYGTEVKTMQDAELPGVVQIGPAGQTAQPTPAPLATPKPPETPAPEAVQTPAPTQNPTTPQNPTVPQAPSSPQSPTATPAPLVVLPTPAAVSKVPTAVATSRPAQTPEATSEPRSTQAPDSSGEAGDSRPPESGSSEVVPEIGEDSLSIPTPAPDGESQTAEEEDSKKGINWFIVIAVAAVLVVVVIEVMAFVVLKKPHGAKGRDRRGQ